jgi:hypothetical protein
MPRVVDARAVVGAVVRRDPSEALELGEELARLLPDHDARERGFLTHDADAGVARDEHEEARLAFGEALLRNRPNGIVLIHRSSPSARRWVEPATAACARARSDAETVAPTTTAGSTTAAAS